MQLDPLPLGKVGPPGNRIFESHSLMIVFLEKAMITGLPLQKKLRNYKNKTEKKTEFFSVRRAWTPPPPPPPPPPPNPTKISWIRAWIYVVMVVEKRYRS